MEPKKYIKIDKLKTSLIKLSPLDKDNNNLLNKNINKAISNKNQLLNSFNVISINKSEINNNNIEIVDEKDKIDSTRFNK